MHSNESGTTGPTSQKAAICSGCGAEAFIETEPLTFEYQDGDHTVELVAHVPVTTCRTCGERFLTPDAQARQHEAVCRHLGLMTPAEILGLRIRHGSRADFATVTKLGEATIGRWERGALLQNAAYDNYLYLLTFSENIARLKYRSFGVPVPSGASSFRAISDVAAVRLKASGFSLRKQAV